jgi:hypothetical protein
MSEPTQADELPRAAIIEIVERHKGPKYPYTGHGSILIPNHLRINGVAIFATVDHPAVIKEIAVGGAPGFPFAVQVQLLARALRFGGVPAVNPAAEGDANAAAVVEIPDLEEFEPGVSVCRPYVLLNGHRLYTEDTIVVGEIATDGEKRTAATVTLMLLCRQLVVDDEPSDAAASA